MDINIERIRDEMKNRNQWLCWEAAMRDGKETKLPKDPETGGFAQTDDPSTWGSFMNANAKVRKGEMDGVGFVFTEDDSYVGIDLDNCRDPEAEEWDDWALDVMEDIGGWIEISPSGTGAHIILKGEIPGDRNRKGDLEMYEDGRFFTITGQLVDENGEPLDDDDDTPEIKEAQLALDAVYDRFLAEDDESANNTEVDVDPDKWGHLDLEDHDGDRSTGSTTGPDLNGLPAALQDIVESAKSANNGYRFTQLWRGNWDGNYPSHSEADMAFCDMLAFWFSGDPERMDRVFRASGLMRPKWDDVRYSDGSTYGERTIEKAIAEVDDHYDDDYYNDLVDEQDDQDDDPPGGSSDRRTHTADREENGDAVHSDSRTEDEDSESPPSKGSPDPDGTDSESQSDPNTSSESTDSTDSKSVDEKQGQSSRKKKSQSRNQNRGRGRGRGRGSGQKRSQKLRDSVPEDATPQDTSEDESSNGTAPQSRPSDTSQETSASPGPDSEDGEEYYTELNPDLDPANDDSGLDFDDDEDSLISGGEPDEDDEEDDSDELPSRDEASDIFDGMDDEEGSKSSSKTSSTDRQSGTEGSDAEASDTDASEDEDTSSGEDTSSEAGGEEGGEEEGEEEEDADKSTVGTRGVDEEYVEQLEERIEVLEDKLEDLEDTQKENKKEVEAGIQRNREQLDTATSELKHNLELEDDKLERVYRELQQYEDTVDERENQLETIYQLLVLLCHVQPEPLFDRVENILLTLDNIPEENIFNESVEEIVDDYNNEEDSVESPGSFESADQVDIGQSPQPAPSQGARPSNRSGETLEGGREDGEPEENEEKSFLSQFF
jgi:putative DNA primase/helicase